MEVDSRNEQGPYALGFLDNISCMLKLPKKDLIAQQQHLLFSCWHQEGKICSHHEARYLTNDEFYQKNCCKPFDNSNRNGTILTYCGRLLSQEKKTMKTSAQYNVTKLSHYDLAYQMGCNNVWGKIHT